jgi:hypothetical protein
MISSAVTGQTAVALQIAEPVGPQPVAGLGQFLFADRFGGQALQFGPDGLFHFLQRMRMARRGGDDKQIGITVARRAEGSD